MNPALQVVQLLVLLAILAFLAFNAWKTLQKPSQEATEPPISLPQVSQVVPDVSVVRKADYEADQSAIQRRFTTLEATMDERHQQLTGLIGALRRQEKGDTKNELAQLVASQVAAVNESRATPTQGRKLVIRRQG